MYQREEQTVGPAGLQHLPSQPWVSSSTHRMTQGAEGHLHKSLNSLRRSMHKAVLLWAKSPQQGAWDSVCHVGALTLQHTERGLTFHQQTDSDQATESDSIVKQVTGSGATMQQVNTPAIKGGRLQGRWKGGNSLW